MSKVSRQGAKTAPEVGAEPEIVTDEMVEAEVLAEEQARAAEIRERAKATGRTFHPQARYPFEPPPGEVGMGYDELVAIGEIDPKETTVGGAYDALIGLMATLKARRAEMGLSLTDVSERSGLTRQAINKLENMKTPNPTLATLFRYAMALDKTIGMEVEDLEDDQDEGESAGGEQGE